MTDERVPPLTADQAGEAAFYARTHDAAPSGGDVFVSAALETIADGRHRVIDTATHSAVPHEELERLRAVDEAARAVCRESVNPVTGGRLILEADIERLDRAIDAAQKEQDQ